MRLRWFLLLSALCLAAALAGCGAPGAGAGGIPGQDPSIVGTVTALGEFDLTGQAGTPAPAADPDQPVSSSDAPAADPGQPKNFLLIEEKPGEEAGSAKARVRVISDTQFFRQRGDSYSKAAPSDLALGQQVKAWFSGPVAESYPVQATASVIVIVEE